MKDVVGEGGRTVVCKGSHGPTMSQSNIEPGGRGDVPREERKKKKKESSLLSTAWGRRLF